MEDLTANGSADPVPALALAFAARPDVVYLLSDGDLPSHAAELPARVAALNPNRRVVLNTVGFVAPPGATGAPADAEPLLQLLRDLATQNGGTFRQPGPVEPFHR